MYPMHLHFTSNSLVLINNNSVYVLVHIPIWTSETLSLKYISSSGMAVCKLWNIHFDRLGLEYSPGNLHLCVLPSAGHKNSKMPTFHQCLLLFSFPISSLICIKWYLTLFSYFCFYWFWVLSLCIAVSFAVSSSVTCQFIPFDHFCFGVDIFLVDLQEFMCISDINHSQLQTLPLSSLILSIVCYPELPFTCFTHKLQCNN